MKYRGLESRVADLEAKLGGFERAIVYEVPDGCDDETREAAIARASEGKRIGPRTIIVCLRRFTWEGSAQPQPTADAGAPVAQESEDEPHPRLWM